MRMIDPSTPVGTTRNPWLRRVMQVLCACVLLAACRPSAQAPAASVLPGGNTRPAQAVRLLTAHLRANDFDAFARDAVPPALHAQLQVAWHEGRTRWPLDELPLAGRLPAMLASLSAPDAQARLQQAFDRQFANETSQLRAAAISLGVFGAQYVSHEGAYSADERAHYAQLIQAMSRWAAAAPLGDAQRAQRVIPQLVAAARRTGLVDAGQFAHLGMDASLQRLGPFAATLKQALAQYGLRLDDSLDDMQVTLLQQTGDSAQVRMRYRLGDSDIDTVVTVQRVAGHWYLGDYLRHAQAAVATPPPAAAAPH